MSGLPSDRTPTGVPIEPCSTCGREHPVTRRHCTECGAASLFPHSVHAKEPS